jgi:glucans biosynthesis protein C
MALTETKQEPQRLHALDAIRAAALLLGIVLHACLSFVPGIPAELWPISDIHKSTALGITMFVIHIFRMSVFFLIAGLLSRALLQRLGLKAFCVNRAARILAPLALGWVVCFALIIAVVLWALAKANHGVMPQTLPKAMMDAGPNFMHLWFLYLLVWLYAIVILARKLMLAIDRTGTIAAAVDRWLRTVVTFPFGSVILAPPVALALHLIPNWIGAMGVPTPGYTLIPPAVPLFIYAYVFAIGWLLDRQRHLLDALARQWLLNFVLGLAGGLVCMPTLGAQAPATVVQNHTLLYATAYAIALVCWTLAFVGLGMRYLNKKSARTRYLSDASYWMYIMHLPLVMALQTALMLVDLHWAVKFFIINAVSCCVLLATYRYCVRSTWIGLMLDGKRQALGITHFAPAESAR